MTIWKLKLIVTSNYFCQFKCCLILWLRKKIDDEEVIIMKQMIKIIRKVDIEKQYEEILLLEMDYELATLYDAMNENNQLEIEKSKKRLTEIQQELKGLHAYV